jgi:hypothetical protein
VLILVKVISKKMGFILRRIKLDNARMRPAKIVISGGHGLRFYE